MLMARSLKINRELPIIPEDVLENKHRLGRGRFYTVNDAGIGVKPIRPGGPPLYIAGFAEPAVKRAARIGDAWLIMNNGLGTVAPLMRTYRAALQEYGRTAAEYPITVECYVGERH